MIVCALFSSVTVPYFDASKHSISTYRNVANQFTIPPALRRGHNRCIEGGCLLWGKIRRTWQVPGQAFEVLLSVVPIQAVVVVQTWGAFVQSMQVQE